MKRKFFFSGLFLLSLLLHNVITFGQGKMGVNLSHSRAFVNVIDEGVTFTNATSLDAQGWPKSNFSINFDWRLVAEWVGTADDPEQYRINKSGIYKCSFEGQADLSGASISNKSYNSTTNLTTFDITVSSTNNGCVFWQLNFNNTKRTAASATNTGITKLKILRPGYELSTTQIFTTEYINLCKSASFACYRYYPVNNVWDGDPVYPATTTWSNRKLPIDASQGNMRSTIGKSEGWCWEYVILLANTLNKDIWINLNSSADDDYVTQLATKLKNELNPGINIYVEYCNEVWGAYNIGTNWVGAQATALGITFDRNYARNVVRVSNLFKNVFGAAAINSRIRVVLGAQKGYIGRSDTHLAYINTTFGAPMNFIYGIAPATYFSGTGASIEEALNNCHTSIMKEYDDVADANSMAQFVKKASDWGLKLISYEGQEHADIGTTDNLTVDIGKHRAARMASEQYANFQSFFDNGGELACQFGLWAPFTRYGCWGLTDDPSNPDRNYKFKAARTLAGDVTNAMPVAAAPLAPSCLAEAVVSATEKKISWVDNATTEEGYELWYKESTWSYWKYYGTVGPNKTSMNFVYPVAGKTYQFRVRAYNYSQWSAYNQPCTGGDIQPPTASTLSTTGKTATTVSLSWTSATDNVGVSGYNVYYGTTKVNTTLLTGTTYTTGLASGKTYNFTVKAADAVGNFSVPSNTITVTTTAIVDTQAPTAPILSTTAKTATTVSLSWTGSTDNVGITGYDVYRGTTLLGSTALTTYTASGLTASTAYTFSVKAKDAAGNVSSASNSLSVTTSATTDAQAPTAPTLSSTAKTTTTVSLSWTGATDNIGVTGYDVYRGTSLLGSTITTTYTATGLTASTAYTFTVKAKDAAGNISSASNSLSVTTNAATDTQAPTAPTLSSPDKTETSVSLSWTASTDNVGVSGYDVYKGGVKVNTTPITTRTYTVSNLASNQTYVFTVKARDAAGNISTASNALSVSIITTELPSVTLNEEVSVSPNPGEGIFYLRIENEEMGTYVLSVYDVIGTCMMITTIEKETLMHESIIDMSNRTGGVYYVIVQFGDKKVVKKVIKM